MITLSQHKEQIQEAVRHETARCYEILDNLEDELKEAIAIALTTMENQEIDND